MKLDAEIEYMGGGKDGVPFYFKLGSTTALEILIEILGEVSIPVTVFETWKTRRLLFTRRGDDIVITLDAPAPREED